MAPKAVTSLVNLQAKEIREAVNNYSSLSQESQVNIFVLVADFSLLESENDSDELLVSP